MAATESGCPPFPAAAAALAPHITKASRSVATGLALHITARSGRPPAASASLSPTRGLREGSLERHAFSSPSPPPRRGSQATPALIHPLQALLHTAPQSALLLFIGCAQGKLTSSLPSFDSEIGYIFFLVFDVSISGSTHISIDQRTISIHICPFFFPKNESMLFPTLSEHCKLFCPQGKHAYKGCIRQ